MSLNVGEAFEKMKVAEIAEIISQKLDTGEDPYAILEECKAGMAKIGAKFETGEYYLAELILSAKMFERATEVLRPKFRGKSSGPGRALGKIVLGTPKGDIHDLGKNIFSIMAQAAGFEVVDLGIDVPPEKFAETVKQEKPEIVGMSALLTTAFPSMKEVVDLLLERGLRDKVKIIIGGGATGKEAQRFTGTDAQTLDANEGVRICRDFIGS